MAKPKPGDTYRYTASTPFGAGPDAMPAGQEVTVRELVPADVAGAHTDSEDAVVVEWQQPTVGFDGDRPVIVNITRATAFSVGEFADRFGAA